jgi:hypothetical protein
MVVKKKTVKLVPKTVTVEASAPLEDAVVKEEKRPAMTQVVEVVEEVPSWQATASSVEAPKPMEMPEVPQEPVSASSGISEAPPMETTITPPNDQKPVDEKRKELVDELFQNKSPNVSPVMPEISIHTNRSRSPLVLWAIVLIVACLVAGGSLLVLSGKKGLPSIVSAPTPTATSTPKTTSTPTPSAAKRSDITIQVLNGGGVVGAATKMKTFLESKGYTVSDTGNADSYTYSKTEIIVKAAKKAYLPFLEGDLKGTYSLGTSSAALDDTVSYDARVIVGKE